MALIRSIGRWSLTALVINCIIGSGIFGVPGPLMGIVGRASPLAMIVAGLGMGVILACVAEVAAQFSEAGGVYLYARTAFGRFVGLQVGWFWFLSALGGAAACANLFVDYMAGMAPWAAHGWQRALVIAVLVLIPGAVNYTGVRRGALLSNLFTVAKLLPLAVLIVMGIIRFGRHANLLPVSEITAPGWVGWGNALLLLLFTYSGYEDVTMPAGEIRDPQRSIPISLITGLGLCIVVYTLVQFVVVATIGTAPTQRPVAASAAVLLGRGGESFVELAVMVSTYGWLSASLLNAPRFLSSLADRGDAPAVLGKLHPRFNTPHISVIVVAGLTWLMSATGSFHWAVLLSSVAGLIFDGVICAALLRLRRLQPNSTRFRLPLGPVFSVLGMAICLSILSRTERTEALLVGLTFFIAAGNWWWARRQTLPVAQLQTADEVAVTPELPR